MNQVIGFKHEVTAASARTRACPPRAETARRGARGREGPHRRRSSAAQQRAATRRSRVRSRASSRSSRRGSSRSRARRRPATTRSSSSRRLRCRTRSSARRPRLRTARSRRRRSTRGVVGIAMRYLGTPYVWGGSSPGGFDCSGPRRLRLRAGRRQPSALHRSAVEHGRPGSRGDLQPGDLVFFDGLGHVGLYIGGGQFIHAPHYGRRREDLLAQRVLVRRDVRRRSTHYRLDASLRSLHGGNQFPPSAPF